MAMRATKLPELRRDMLRHMSTDRASVVFRYFVEHGGVPGYRHDSDSQLTDDAKHLLEEECERWRMSDLFMITEEMTHFAIVASKSLPNFKLERQDLPSDFGFMQFAVPVWELNGLSIVACMWGPHQRFYKEDSTTVRGIWLSFFTTSAEAIDAAYQDGAIESGQVINLKKWYPDLCHATNQFWPWGAGDDLARDRKEGSIAEVLRVIRTTWLFMQQEVSSVHRIRPTHAEARNLRRRNLNLNRVRVVSLRRRHTDSAHGDGNREYNHRWVVKGHWRNQWYPSQDRHIPIWINAHVKGPDKAPFLTGDVVNVWSR